MLARKVTDSFVYQTPLVAVTLREGRLWSNCLSGFHVFLWCEPMDSKVKCKQDYELREHKLATS